MPSSSIHHDRFRFVSMRSLCAVFMTRSALMVSCTILSICDPVALRARSSQRCSLVGVATRQIARTRENETSPRPNDSRIAASSTSLRATATCWRAVLMLIPACTLSQWAIDTHSHCS